MLNYEDDGEAAPTLEQERQEVIWKTTDWGKAGDED